MLNGNKVSTRAPFQVKSKVSRLLCSIFAFHGGHNGRSLLRSVRDVKHSLRQTGRNLQGMARAIKLNFPSPGVIFLSPPAFVKPFASFRLTSLRFVPFGDNRQPGKNSDGYGLRKKFF